MAGTRGKIGPLGFVDKDGGRGDGWEELESMGKDMLRKITLLRNTARCGANLEEARLQRRIEVLESDLATEKRQNGKLAAEVEALKADKAKLERRLREAKPTAILASKSAATSTTTASGKTKNKKTTTTTARPSGTAAAAASRRGDEDEDVADADDDEVLWASEPTEPIRSGRRVFGGKNDGDEEAIDAEAQAAAIVAARNVVKAKEQRKRKWKDEEKEKEEGEEEGSRGEGAEDNEEDDDEIRPSKRFRVE